jgi:hypothetical protein
MVCFDPSDSGCWLILLGLSDSGFMITLMYAVFLTMIQVPFHTNIVRNGFHCMINNVFSVTDAPDFIDQMKH